MCNHHQANVECAYSVLIYLHFHVVLKPCGMFYGVTAEWWGRKDPTPTPVFKQVCLDILNEALKGQFKLLKVDFLIYL